MLDSLYLGVSVVWPLLLYMIAGGLVKKAGWVSDKSLEELNKLVFRFFLAVMIFLNAYLVDIYHVFNQENRRLLLLCLICIALIYTIAKAAAGRLVRDRQRRAVIIQGIFRSNLALYGIPVSAAIYGEGNQGSIAAIVVVVVPIYNIIAELLLSRAAEQKVSVPGMIKKVFTNPLAAAALLGLLFSLCRIQLPHLLMIPLENIAKAATPLAFVVLGGSLTVKNMRNNWKAITGVSLLRLVLIPALVILTALALGMRTYSLVALLGVFASPAAVSSYTMARDMEVAPDLAGELVAVTTLLSIVTMFFWIAVLRYFGFI